MRRRLYLVAAAAGILAAALALNLVTTHPDLTPHQPVRTTDPFTVEAVPGLATVGQPVKITVTVKGPATYSSCRPVYLRVTDSSGRTRWTLVQFWACTTLGPQHLPAGRSASFTYQWPTAGLAPGPYTVHSTFNPGTPGTSPQTLPVVTVVLK